MKNSLKELACVGWSNSFWRIGKIQDCCKHTEQLNETGFGSNSRLDIKNRIHIFLTKLIQEFRLYFIS